MPTGATQQIIDSQQWLDGFSKAVQKPLREAFAAGGEGGKVVKDFLNGVWLGHPLHPVITDVPVGAWTITQLFDVISLMRGDDPGLDAAADISLGAGIAAAVAAAVTGITDWTDTSGAQRRMGMAHALINVGGLALNVTSLALRMSSKKGAGRGTARVLSASGYMLNALAAYVAGELVYNLGQAINRDAWVSGPEKFTDALAVEELRPDEMVKGEADGRAIVFVQHDDGIHAFDGTCPHFGCELWEGTLDGHKVICPCHGSEFDIRDGTLIHGPATSPVPSYEARKYGGKVQVRLKK